MGTNYYAVKKKPTISEPLHIGKSSVGWKFLFQEINKYNSFDWDLEIHTFEQLKDFLENNNEIVILNEYDELRKDYYEYYSKCLFAYKFTICSNFLNNEVEIIEEPKKIKKLPKEITDNVCATRDQKIIANKIDELIDEINNLKEK